jgi:hypothetical protein
MKFIADTSRSYGSVTLLLKLKFTVYNFLWAFSKGLRVEGCSKYSNEGPVRHYLLQPPPPPVTFLSPFIFSSLLLECNVKDHTTDWFENKKQPRLHNVPWK